MRECVINRNGSTKYLVVIFRALSLQSGTGSETIRSLMGNLPTGLVLATRQQAR